MIQNEHNVLVYISTFAMVTVFLAVVYVWKYHMTIIIGRAEASPPLSVQFAEFSLYLFIYFYI